MLSQSEMIVVFVPREQITQGSLTNGEDESKFFNMILFIKCRSDDAFGNKRVKRGKPREREIQNWQESPNEGNRTELGTGQPVDKCLSPR